MITTFFEATAASSPGFIRMIEGPVEVATCVSELLLGTFATAFGSAESFLKSGQLHDTSCLILDVRMPDMNGFELQSKLAAAGYSIPIIFVTAYDDKESRGRAMQAGAVAFLGKPFSDEQLLQIVRSALGRDNGGTKSM